ncbi:uncharacterized protein LOC118322108 [Scomber scombrus]|uniref:Uncharacterized protein LOC118322108 n=1 Tax=Scomber scombrus TaxID=13677 RepID=A0AAV1PC76_SCOSC
MNKMKQDLWIEAKGIPPEVTGVIRASHILTKDCDLCHIDDNISRLSKPVEKADRFLFENFYFDKHVRYIMTFYPVVILWLTGTLSNSATPESATYIFEGMLTSLLEYGNGQQRTQRDVVKAVSLTWILPVLSFYMLYMSYSNLNKSKAWLAINNPNEIWWIRYLTQNGLAMFAWWTLLKAVLGLGVILKYKAGVEDPLVSTIVLTITFLYTLAWFILQSFLLTKYMHYTFTVYPILILGLGAMFTRSYGIYDIAPNTIYCGFLMLLMTIMNLVHLISLCLYTDKSSKPVAMEPFVTFESCKTVCQPEGKIQQKL